MTLTPVRLIAATVDMLAAENASAAALCALLGLSAPPVWPPPNNGPEIRNWVIEKLTMNPGTLGWWTWYIVAEVDGHDTLAGTAGYKGPPSDQGTVEIGYSVIEPLHRRGIAGAAISQLCNRAFAEPRVNAVLAETLAGSVASQGALLKMGFTRCGEYVDPEDGKVWQYRLPRAVHQGT
ncbi:GNAT family protein [Devosia sp.]|uniref:GNAT family N-acetyltransferase n=1 Tax=Devosia sp. TaxID=1871048 RepID=UPI0032653571